MQLLPQNGTSDAHAPVTKTRFTTEALIRDRTTDLDSLNREWRKAGHEDTISLSTYQKVKTELQNGRYTPLDPKFSGRPSPEPEPEDTLLDLERDLDALVYRAMAFDELEEVAGALRSARRVLSVLILEQDRREAS
jgi:hypothetical protein